ncbi:hypothetical protein JCM6882_001953 [Rhodosporidiobolus microsporus]
MSPGPSQTSDLSSHPVVLAASALAQQHHARYDPSHDFHHVTRVRRLAVSIAKSLNSTCSSSPESGADGQLPVDVLVVTLAALTHDLLDAKYLPPGAPSSARGLLEPFWAQYSAEEISEEQRRLVERVVENVSYSKEKKRIAAGEETEWHRTSRELHCVQDADKLDAIGAFGIMRCAAYSAITSRPLYLPPVSPSPSPQQAPLSSSSSAASPSDDSAIAHFHDKLLKLEALMKTPRGKELARRRTEFLRVFVGEVEREWAEGGEEEGQKVVVVDA